MTSPFADLLDKGQLTDKAKETLEFKFNKDKLNIGVDLSLPPMRDYTVMLMRKDISGPLLCMDFPREKLELAGEALKKAAKEFEISMLDSIINGKWPNVSVGFDAPKEREWHPEECKALEEVDTRSYARKLKKGERRAITKHKKHAKKMRRRQK